ncbi:MAG: hypothetical protein LBF75_09730 [Treponema sp.]|nr:hypothetical protein [Treponema sp.]
MKQKPEGPYKSFDDGWFWLQWACMDFTFGRDDMMNNESDSGSRKLTVKKEEPQGEKPESASKNRLFFWRPWGFPPCRAVKYAVCSGNNSPQTRFAGEAIGRGMLFS